MAHPRPRVVAYPYLPSDADDSDRLRRVELAVAELFGEVLHLRADIAEVRMAQTSGTLPALYDNVKKTTPKAPRKTKR